MNSQEQAKKIYVLCVASAERKDLLTYGEVLCSLGYPNGVSGNAIRYGLELLLLACVINKLPILSSIVVNQSTNVPTGSQIDSRVFDQEGWPHVDHIDWKYIWNNRKKLSDKYGSPGYWGN